MNLSSSVAGIKLDVPIFNASGPRCTTIEELNAIGESDAGAILTKSATLEPREGNPEPRYYEFHGGSINSMGLPNLGYKEYLNIIPKLKIHNKPIFASVSGLKLDHNLEIIKEYCKLEELKAIELNLSCPNVIGKPQIGYDFEQSTEVLEEVGKICTKPLGVKLPPYFDMSHFDSITKVLNNSKIKFVTCINSPGNGLVIDPETESIVIKPKGGFGGIGGTVVKPFGLSNVRKMRELLREDISVIGVGGITKGSDAFEYFLAGADAVQIGTAYQTNKVSIFSKVKSELEDYMKKKNYESIDEFKNKLKVI